MCPCHNCTLASGSACVFSCFSTKQVTKILYVCELASLPERTCQGPRFRLLSCQHQWTFMTSTDRRVAFLVAGSATGNGRALAIALFYQYWSWTFTDADRKGVWNEALDKYAPAVKLARIHTVFLWLALCWNSWIHMQSHWREYNYDKDTCKKFSSMLN